MHSTLIITEYGKTPGAIDGELKDLICRNNKWHNDNNTEPSTSFTPEFIEEFVNKVADEYNQWRIQREIEYYNSLPVNFADFFGFEKLSDGEIELFCDAKKPAIHEKKWVPAYDFEIKKNNNRVGRINLRICYTDGLYYGGHIGYSVDEHHRGHGYAEKACRLLTPVLKAHGMNKVLITNNHTNIASKRTCEKLGAKLIRIAPELMKNNTNFNSGKILEKGQSLDDLIVAFIDLKHKEQENKF